MRSSVLPTFIYCFLKCPFYKAFYAFLNSALPFYPISLWVETFHSRWKQISLILLCWVLFYAHWVEFLFFWTFCFSLTLPNFAISSSNFVSVTWVYMSIVALPSTCRLVRQNEDRNFDCLHIFVWNWADTLTGNLLH